MTKPDIKTIAMNGQPGSYHDQVFLKYLAANKPLYCDNFKEVFYSVINGTAEYGLVAVENALYGSINEVDALLMETGLQIVEEFYLRINFCLIGLDGVKLKDITDVYSQNIALAQCHIWFDKHLPQAKLHDIGDTSGSVAYVKEQGDPTKAALSSKHSAELFGLKVIAENLENDAKNFTRFVLIAKNPKPITAATKTSIVLIAANKPGSLHDVLGMFKEFKINLTKLDSKPIAGKPWEYMFFIDFEAGLQEAKVKRLLSALDDDGHHVQTLGSFVGAQAPKA